VASAFPDEPIPDGLVDRLTAGSLHHALHREALADLYLHLVVPDRAKLSERDLGAHRRWAAEMRTRAGRITWEPDGDVVISVSWLGKRADVVPDAVIRSATLRRRIFVELDRSTKDLGRIRECLDRYVQVFRSLDLGGDVPSLLFVVRSAARKANLEALGRTLGNPLDLVVLREPEAVEWLREEILSISPEAGRSREESVPAVARRAYLWMIQLDRVMRANGMHDALNGDEPALMKEGRDRLLALYHSLKILETERARP
jgi:hypothetical protein